MTRLLLTLSAGFVFALGFAPSGFAQEAGEEITPAIDMTAPIGDTPVETAPVESAAPAEETLPPETITETPPAIEAPMAETPAETETSSPETSVTEVPATETPSESSPSTTAPASEQAAAINEAMEGGPVPEGMQPPVDFSKMNSIFFTKWEHDILLETRLGTVTRPVIPGGVTPDVELLVNPNAPPVVESPREISLGGIAYVSSKDWVVWLNGTRITPTAIPSTVMDLRVYKDHIDLEWLDRTTNQIYPIRLRTHQKFNLDTRMFLPADS